MDSPAPSAVVARRIREHRELHGLTQAALAHRLDDHFGWCVDRSVIARMEAGTRIVNVDELFMLAGALDTTPVLLLTPCDEMASMSPTPWRSMTSNRVRAWISDAVRLWEQDQDAYVKSSAAAWRRSAEHEAELDQLGSRLAAIHQVESLEQIDRDVELTASSAADAEMLALRFTVAGQRHSWELTIGEWTGRDIDASLELLSQRPVTVAEASVDLWGHRAVDEIAVRNERLLRGPVDTAEDSRRRAGAMLESLRAVVAQLLAASDGSVSHAQPLEPPLSRPSGQGPA